MYTGRKSVCEVKKKKKRSVCEGESKILSKIFSGFVPERLVRKRQKLIAFLWSLH